MDEASGMIQSRRRRFLDRFTSMDEKMDIMLATMENINRNLEKLVTVMVRQVTVEKKETVEDVLRKYGIIEEKVTKEQQIPIITLPNINVIPMTSAPVDIARISKLEVTDTDDTYIDLLPETNVIVIMSPDVDLWMGKTWTEAAQPFPILQGTGISLVRSKKLNRLYFRAQSGSGYVYVMELSYSE